MSGFRAQINALCRSTNANLPPKGHETLPRSSEKHLKSTCGSPESQDAPKRRPRQAKRPPRGHQRRPRRRPRAPKRRPREAPRRPRAAKRRRKPFKNRGWRFSRMKFLIFAGWIALVYVSDGCGIDFSLFFASCAKWPTCVSYWFFQYKTPFEPCSRGMSVCTNKPGKT